MTGQERHAEAHRLRAELGYGARRIAKALSVSRYAAEQLLDEPLPVLVAEAADEARPVADEVAGVAVRTEATLQPVAAPVGQVAGQEWPVADRVAEVADQEQPVADLVAEAADEARPVAEPVADAGGQEVAVPSGPVWRVAGVAGLVFRPVADVPSAPVVPWLQVELGGRPWLLRELRRLTWLGLRLPTVVDLAVRSFAAAYHQAITTGRLQPGQPYEVQTHIRPRQHQAAV